MREYDFSQVDVAIIDTQQGTQRLLRDVLSRLGLKRSTNHGSVAEAADVLSNSTPDLILVDVDGDEDALKAIRALRNDPATRNPYTGIVATTWHPTPLLLMRISNAGADDLLVKPLSPKHVQDRLTVLIEARKKFVVTADYIGPDRRKSARDGTQVPLLDAPNTLRLKASGRFASTSLPELMGSANAFVNEQKRLRTSVQIAFLIEFAAPGLSVRPVPERMAVEHLARVPGFLDDLHRRLAGGGSSSGGGDANAAGAICRALKPLSETLRIQAESGSVSTEELDRARGLARDLMRSVDPSRPLESMVAEVSSAVAGYRARLEQMAQAKLASAAPPAPAAAASETAEPAKEAVGG